MAGGLRVATFYELSGILTEMLKEDMDTLGPVRIKDVEAAQQEIIGVVRKLQSEGTLSIGEAGKEEYVL